MDWKEVLQLTVIFIIAALFYYAIALTVTITPPPKYLKRCNS